MKSILDIKISSDDLEIEYEVLSTIDINKYEDSRRQLIDIELLDVDEKLTLIEDKIAELNTDIERLTNHADGIDYMISVASGIVSGIVDSIFVGEFSLEEASKWGTKKTENFVLKVAKSQGYNGDKLSGAVSFLEDKYKIAADKATSDFGGGKQHHLRDFSHHPTPIGLMFSMLTQFTKKVYGTDTNGFFKVVELKEEDLVLIGNNTKEKFVFGTVTWFFHMVSDMVGASGTISGKESSYQLGTGLPGPIVSLLKELSALPIFNKMDKNGRKEFSVWISKLFNGTLLGERDENGELIKPLKFDLRTEIGIAREVGRQSIPVILNECIVRSFYFIRRLFEEIRDKGIKKFKDLKKIDWRRTAPFKNRTIVRMMTIATGTFTAIDLADAGIRAVINSGGFNPETLRNFILRVNFVGVGRFAIAVVTDIGMGVSNAKKRNEKIKLRTEQLQLLDSKVYYKQAGMWIAAESTEETLNQAYNVMEHTAEVFLNAVNDINTSLNNIGEVSKNIEEKNPGLINDLSEIIEWG